MPVLSLKRCSLTKTVHDYCTRERRTVAADVATLPMCSREREKHIERGESSEIYYIMPHVRWVTRRVYHMVSPDDDDDDVTRRSSSRLIIMHFIIIIIIIIITCKEMV